MSNTGINAAMGFTPHPVRLAIFNAIPAWRRFRSLHQVPDLPGEYILTLNRVIVATRRSAIARYMGMQDFNPLLPALKN